MKVSVSLPAAADLIAAMAYYDMQSEGLGSQFAEEVDGAIAKMIRFPRAWAALGDDLHRCQTDRFPCGIYYHLEGESIEILAILDLRRDAATWQRRLRELGLRP